MGAQAGVALEGAVVAVVAGMVVLRRVAGRTVLWLAAVPLKVAGGAVVMASAVALDTKVTAGPWKTAW